MLPQIRRIDDPDLGTCAWMETVSPTWKVEEEFPMAMVKLGKESSGEAAHVVAFCPTVILMVEREGNITEKGIRTDEDGCYKSHLDRFMQSRADSEWLFTQSYTCH